MVTNMQKLQSTEKHLSQIPALQLLMNMGYQYLSPSEALKERARSRNSVLLENILREQLKKFNQISYKGKNYFFSEENIQSAIHKLKNIKYDGLLSTNETVYDLLTLGTALEQNIEGDQGSFDLHYIDWKNIENNVFHVTAEFAVERYRSLETARPDIVLFVNGIPLVVIECKAPEIDIDEAISQMIRNQTETYIPKLFIYAQLLIGTNKNEIKYSTVGASKPFWGYWRELEDQENTVQELANHSLTEKQKRILFSDEFTHLKPHFDQMEQTGIRQLTEQDKVLFSLCRHERLLELIYKFTIFDNGVKKIARYQQYFVIRQALIRVMQRDPENRRQGGMIWHTQGSGKSLTMVWLARNLALQKELIPNPRIVLVTDRDDLDKQLKNTFAACGLHPERARSGKDLMQLVSENDASIITTIINKFDKALKYKNYREMSDNIFMLVDESHRTNFGNLAARMRQMFPNACYLGFTGTPLLKKEKNNFAKFGGLIEPHYSINRALADKVVVPLLYEGRHVEMRIDQQAIDLWFDRHTQGLTLEQKRDLKKKYARSEMLNKTDQVIYMRAFDMSENYRENWQGTDVKFKAQLVAPNKASALKYHEYLNEIGYVTSEVIISAPDKREGYDDVDDEPTDAVVRFWNKMMNRYGSEAKYNKQIVNQFKNGDDPEILIVVDKLLTGFDAPRNTVLYLCRKLREHTLLQAIARVNRLYEKKDFGFIIDYASVLGELDKAIHLYSALENYDATDLESTLFSIQSEISRLPQRYSDLWDIFKTVKNQYDEEAYERLLSDKALRDEFYQRLTEFGKTLAIAFASEQFMENIEDHKLLRYKNDLRRFEKMRLAVKKRYAEIINYQDYEPKIKKLLDTHVHANEVLPLNEPIDIFDNHGLEVRESQAVYQIETVAAQADAIAHATRRMITEKMVEDPAFYEKFSKLIQQAIDDFKLERISDLEYLNLSKEISKSVSEKRHDDIPAPLQNKPNAIAFYGVIKPIIDTSKDHNNIAEKIALAIDNILAKHWKVDFWNDIDAQHAVKNDIDDFLFDEIKHHHEIDLTEEQIDLILQKTLQVAKNRMKS